MVQSAVTCDLKELVRLPAASDGGLGYLEHQIRSVHLSTVVRGKRMPSLCVGSDRCLHLIVSVLIEVSVPSLTIHSIEAGKDETVWASSMYSTYYVRAGALTTRTSYCLTIFLDILESLEVINLPGRKVTGICIREFRKKRPRIRPQRV